MDKSTQEKFEYVFKVIRVKVSNNIFRVFCCFDAGRIVILFNGFQKKSQKTPKKEINKAKELKSEYFNKQTGG